MEERREKRNIFRRHIDTIVILMAIVVAWFLIDIRLSAIEGDLVDIRRSVSIISNMATREAFTYHDAEYYGTCHICGAPMTSSGECANGHRPNSPGPDKDRDHS